MIANKSKKYAGLGRRYTARHSINDNRTIFQVKDPFIEVTLIDVEDLLAVYATQKENTYDSMIQQFYSNGVDYERVVLYYNKVTNLNRILKASEPRTISQNISDFLTVFMISFQIMYNIMYNIACNIAMNVNYKVNRNKL